MYDSAGEIIGMNTAAAQAADSRPTRLGHVGSSSSTAYAIPIDNALSIAEQIESGIATATIHIGLPAFIGVGVADATGGGAADQLGARGRPGGQRRHHRGLGHHRGRRHDGDLGRLAEGGAGASTARAPR